MNILKALVWIFFAAIVYLIAVEVVGPWFRLPGLGNIGFTLVFVLFAVLHCAQCEGWKRTGLFFVTAAFISYLLEEIGVRTGLIYGPYHYSARPQAGTRADSHSPGVVHDDLPLVGHRAGSAARRGYAASFGNSCTRAGRRNGHDCLGHSDGSRHGRRR